MMAEGTFELHPGDALYPETVLELSDVPQTLYVRGNPEVLSTPALSIIGARKASPYGLAVAELAAKVAVEAGVTVVSGGAVGCDQASGWAAVNAGGKHVVVLGTGADVVYPRSSAGLITRTLDTGGAVVSISPWGMGPRKFAFPRRNRVIAALSQALFVSEAGMPSGTFSTAEAAMDLGRELLAVPGSILSPESRGTNYLIANGLLHCRRGVHRDGYLSHIRHPALLAPRCSRHCRPESNTADRDACAHRLSAQGRRHRGARLTRCCRRTQTLGFA